jgi:SAM-dependent methyltransferase
MLTKDKYCIFSEIKAFNSGMNKEFPFIEFDFSEKCLEIHLSQENDTGSRRKVLIQNQLYYILQKKITIPNDLTILDIGCGPGLYLEGLINQLNHNDFEYIGIDKGPALINYALNTYNISNANFILNDIFEYDFRRKNFNLILMMYDFFNFFFFRKKMNELISMVSALLGKDGYLIMEVKVKSEFSDYDINFFYRENGLFSENRYMEIIEQGVVNNHFYGHRHFICEIDSKKTKEYYNFLNILKIEEIRHILSVNNLKIVDIISLNQDKYRKILVIRRII